MKSIRVVVVSIIVCVGAIGLFAKAQAAKPPEKIPSSALPNAYRLTDKVLSGGQPQGEPAFKELKRMGVQTVISVDGATPNVALAKKFGLRYVHLPHGYDGIPDARLLELTKAIRDLPGPIYIHCHHGKHRSPAAAAAACVSGGYLSNVEGLAVLETAGTSKGYRGLFQSVREARAISSKTLDETKVAFRETVDVPPLADAMIEIEHTHDNLKHIASAGWKPTEKHADIDPPHEVLLLREHFTELLRTAETKKQPAEFGNLLRNSEMLAHKLENRLRASKHDPPEFNILFERITADCTACHQQFRDVPLKEKSPVKQELP